jgi:hypothetical protein
VISYLYGMLNVHIIQFTFLPGFLLLDLSTTLRLTYVQDAMVSSDPHVESEQPLNPRHNPKSFFLGHRQILGYKLTHGPRLCHGT